MLLFDEIKKSDPQLRVVAIGMALGMAVLVVGLWYVQVVLAKRYRADLQEQSLRIVRVPAAALRRDADPEVAIRVVLDRVADQVHQHLLELDPRRAQVRQRGLDLEPRHRGRGQQLPDLDD